MIRRSVVQDTSMTANDSSEMPEALPRKIVLALAAGYLGMSILMNLLNTLLVFFYLPPDTAGLPSLVTDTTVLGILNVIALIAAAGRFTDAITDPIIASRSDSSTHRKGRRIPFMAVGMIPAAVFTLLMFTPPVGEESGWNIVWLLGIQVLLYISLTAYVTPAFALVADLGSTPSERLRLSTWTSMAWAIGLVLAATTLFLAGLLDGPFSVVRGWQVAVGIVCTIALLFMMVPIFMIDERKYAHSQPSTMPLFESLKGVLGNPFFRFYAAADFAYFGGLAIIQTGILFYVTVLLELEEWVSTVLLLLMVIVSAFLFPLVAGWARRQGGGKRLTVFAFLVAAGRVSCHHCARPGRCSSVPASGLADCRVCATVRHLVGHATVDPGRHRRACCTDRRRGSGRHVLCHPHLSAEALHNARRGHVCLALAVWS